MEEILQQGQPTISQFVPFQLCFWGLRPCLFEQLVGNADYLTQQLVDLVAYREVLPRVDDKQPTH